MMVGAMGSAGPPTSGERSGVSRIQLCRNGGSSSAPSRPGAVHIRSSCEKHPPPLSSGSPLVSQAQAGTSPGGCLSFIEHLLCADGLHSPDQLSSGTPGAERGVEPGLPKSQNPLLWSRVPGHWLSLPLSSVGYRLDLGMSFRVSGVGWRVTISPLLSQSHPAGPEARGGLVSLNSEGAAPPAPPRGTTQAPSVSSSDPSIWVPARPDVINTTEHAFTGSAVSAAFNRIAFYGFYIVAIILFYTLPFLPSFVLLCF